MKIKYQSYGGRDDYGGPMGGPPRFGGRDDYAAGGPGFGDYGPPPPTTCLMVYNLNKDVFNCDRLFNLLCLFGNIERIIFLSTKIENAIVQFDHPSCLDMVKEYLQNVNLFGKEVRTFFWGGFSFCHFFLFSGPFRALQEEAGGRDEEPGQAERRQ